MSEPVCRICGASPVYFNGECSACVKEHLGPGAETDDVMGSEDE